MSQKTPTPSSNSDPPPPDLLPPTLNPTALTTAIASLAPALELLERFHHRNKNQHRLCKWWAQADMLRRQVRKMLGELEGGVEGAERAERMRARVMAKGGKGKLGGGGGDKGGVEAVVVEKRAGYLRGVLGPGAFLAFTQLSADRQFAHLGLMLLGVLAQVDKAVAPFALAPSGAPDTAESEPPAVTGTRTAGTEETALDRGADVDMDTDMGVAVSREEIMRSIERDATPGTSTSTPIPQPPPAGQTHPRSISLPVNPPSKRKLPTHPTAAKTEPPSKESSTNPDPAKPKKKKTRKGDEFDAIFGSLDQTPAAGKTTLTKKKSNADKADDELNPVFDSSEPPPAAKSKPKPKAEAASKDPSTTRTPNPAPSEPKKTKQKKTRKEGAAAGDEFDTIFGSLDGDSSARTKKKKKKKGKKGDEFDDIFGGL